MRGCGGAFSTAGRHTLPRIYYEIINISADICDIVAARRADGMRYLLMKMAARRLFDFLKSHRKARAFMTFHANANHLSPSSIRSPHMPRNNDAGNDT